MGKKQKQPEPETEIPEHVVQAFKETQKKLEILQTQLDKLNYRIGQEKKKQETAKLALKFINDPNSQLNSQSQTSAKFYMQVGKAFSMRPFAEMQAELKLTCDTVDKELPKLLIAQAQFDLKKKEQLNNLQSIAQLAKQNTSAKATSAVATTASA